MKCQNCFKKHNDTNFGDYCDDCYYEIYGDEGPDFSDLN